MVYAWTLIGEHSGIGPAPAVFVILPFLAYYALPSTAGIGYLVLCQVVLVLAWRNSPAPSHARRWIVGYNLLLVVFYGYLAWWFSTGQHARPIGGYL